MIVPYYLDTRSNSRANTCVKTQLSGRVAFIRLKPMRFGGIELSHNNYADRVFGRDVSTEFLPHQLWMVGYWPTMAFTGNGGLGFDSGEGALETATTSKEGSRRVNYPIITDWGSDNK